MLHALEIDNDNDGEADCGVTNAENREFIKI